MLAVESFDPRLIWDSASASEVATCLIATPPPPVPESRAVARKQTRLSARLAGPDRRRARRRLGRRHADPERGADDHDRLRLGRGARGRQDQDPLQRRRRRHAHDDPALGRSPAASSPPRRWRPRPRTSWSRTRKFWVVRPRISGANVSRAGHADLRLLHRHGDRQTRRRRKRDFVALDTPPVVAGDVARPLLHAEDARPGLARHRHADLLPPPAGRRGGVVRRSTRTARRSPSRSSCKAPYDQYVTPNTRFWQASGIDVSLSAERPQRADAVAALDPDRRHRLRDARHRSGAVGRPRPETELHAVRATGSSAFKRAARDPQTYLLVFDQSVRGLAVGAPVEFRGIPIGEVAEHPRAVRCEDLRGSPCR